MNQTERVEHYKNNWEVFRKYCENKAKDSDCHINNKGWQKLREYHLENYLQSVDTPYGFLFTIKFRHRNLYTQIKCMPKIFYKYSKIYREQFDSPAKAMVQFPSWRRK
jgi:hypothetical protein